VPAIRHTGVVAPRLGRVSGRARSGGRAARGVRGGVAPAQAAHGLLPGGGAAGGTHRQGRPAAAAGAGRGTRLTLAAKGYSRSSGSSGCC